MTTPPVILRNPRKPLTGSPLETGLEQETRGGGHPHVPVLSQSSLGRLEKAGRRDRLQGLCLGSIEVTQAPLPAIRLSSWLRPVSSACLSFRVILPRFPWASLETRRSWFEVPNPNSLPLALGKCEPDCSHPGFSIQQKGLGWAGGWGDGETQTLPVARSEAPSRVYK